MKIPIFVLTFMLTLVLNSFGQVTLPDRAARFYFERHKKAELLEQQIVIKDKRLLTLGEQIILKDSIIASYENDITVYKYTDGLHRNQIKLAEDENAKLKKEVRRQKRIKTMILGGLMGIFILNEVLNGTN